ncbi:MAG: STAS domain-containing protein [Euzebyales bacterium]|nr:STAS domain-containing protein [Euzebyales bacterium]
MEPGQAPRAPHEPGVITVGIAAPIARADVAGICDRVRALLSGSGRRLVVCDMGAVKNADLATVHALARIHLTERRVGGRVTVRGVSPPLHELLALVGLCDVVGPCADATSRGGEADRTAGTPCRCPGRT